MGLDRLTDGTITAVPVSQTIANSYAQAAESSFLDAGRHYDRLMRRRQKREHEYVRTRDYRSWNNSQAYAALAEILFQFTDFPGEVVINKDYRAMGDGRQGVLVIQGPEVLRYRANTGLDTREQIQDDIAIAVDIWAREFDIAPNRLTWDAGLFHATRLIAEAATRCASSFLEEPIEIIDRPEYAGSALQYVSELAALDALLSTGAAARRPWERSGAVELLGRTQLEVHLKRLRKNGVSDLRFRHWGKRMLKDTLGMSMDGASAREILNTRWGKWPSQMVD